jgi:hypothetical protein
MHEYVPTQYMKSPHGFRRTFPALIIVIAVGSIVTNKRASTTPKDRTVRMLLVHVEVACDFEDDGRESMCERNVFCRRSLFFPMCIPSAEDAFESLHMPVPANCSCRCSGHEQFRGFRIQNKLSDKRDDVGSRKAASDLFQK